MGPQRLPGMSLIVRRVACSVEDVSYEEEAYKLAELEQNLVSLTRGILEHATFDDIPLCFHRHTVGVLGRLRWLL